MKPLVDNKSNFSWLLAALIFLLFSDALFAEFNIMGGQRLVNITLMVTVVIAVWSVETTQGRFVNWKLGMSIIIVALMVGDSILESNALALYQLTASFLFLIFTLHLTWKQVMFSGVVDRNKIVGAICIYILIGVIWAFAYLIAEALFPGSFNGMEPGIWQHKFEDFIYFSLVTMTTLGYGDISPAQPLTRFLAYMEAITGIFYTTVLVASLIGMRLAHYEKNLDEDRER